MNTANDPTPDDKDLDKMVDADIQSWREDQKPMVYCNVCHHVQLHRRWYHKQMNTLECTKCGNPQAEFRQVI